MYNFNTFPVYADFLKITPINSRLVNVSISIQSFCDKL